MPPEQAAGEEVDWGRGGVDTADTEEAEGAGGLGRGREERGRRRAEMGRPREGVGARLPKQTQQLPAAAGGPRRAPQGERRHPRPSHGRWARSCCPARRRAQAEAVEEGGSERH